MTPLEPTPNRHLAARRAFLGVSQHTLAFRAKLSRDRIWRIENGVAEPTADERDTIAAALETTVAELFPQPSAELAS